MKIMIAGFIRIHNKKFSYGMRIIKTRKPVLGKKEEKLTEKPAIEQLNLFQDFDKKV